MTLQSLDELEKQLLKQIEQFNKRRQRTRMWRNSLLIFQVLFTALTTFLIALNIKFGADVLNIVAVACSVTATVLGIFQTSFMFHDRLHTFTQTSGRLQGVLARLRMQRLRNTDNPVACPLDTTTVEHLFLEMQSILESANEQWSQMMKENKPKASLDDQFKNNHSQ
jgi:hypothetical protein